jgi:hypothetical protein
MMLRTFARVLTIVSLLGAGFFVWRAPEASALEELRGEEEAIKACDKRLCTMLTQKNAKGEDLKCALTKTWAKSKIKEAENSKLTWGYGDARCTVDINIERVAVVQAMTGERDKFWLQPHTANCIVESDGKQEKVTATLAPKLVFKEGKVDQIWINLKSVEGPATIKATIYTAAELADRLGLFHRRMVKSANRYIERHCAKEYGVVAGKDKAK